MEAWSRVLVDCFVSSRIVLRRTALSTVFDDNLSVASDVKMDDRCDRSRPKRAGCVTPVRPRPGCEWLVRIGFMAKAGLVVAHGT